MMFVIILGLILESNTKSRAFRDRTMQIDKTCLAYSSVLPYGSALRLQLLGRTSQNQCEKLKDTELGVSQRVISVAKGYVDTSPTCRVCRRQCSLQGPSVKVVRL